MVMPQAGESRYTYRELIDRVEALVAAIRDQGLAAGARVVVIQETTPDSMVSLLALLTAGATIVELPVDCTREVVQRVLQESPVRGFLGDPRGHLLRLRSRVGRSVPTKISTRSKWWGLLAELSVSELIDGVRSRSGGGAADIPNDEVSVSDAGGEWSSRRANGDPFRSETDATLRSELDLWSSEFPIRDGEVEFSTDRTRVLMLLGSGMTAVLPNFELAEALRSGGRISGSAVCEQLRSERVTTASIVPAVMEALTDRIQSSPGDRPTLRRILVLSGPDSPVTVAEVDRWRSAWGRTQLLIVFGVPSESVVAYAAADEFSVASSSTVDADPLESEGLGGSHGARFVGVPPTRIQLDVIRRPGSGAGDPASSESIGLDPGRVGDLCVVSPTGEQRSIGVRGFRDEEGKFWWVPSVESNPPAR